MKKYLVFLLGIVVIAVIAVFALLVSKQVDYQKTLISTSSTVLVLSNFSDIGVKIRTGNSDEIQIDLKGANADLAGASIQSNGIFAEFGFSDAWEGVTGTITVPKGIIIDVNLATMTDLEIQDLEGDEILSSVESFIINTQYLNSLSFDGSGAITLDSNGDMIVWNNSFEVHQGGPDDDPAKPSDLYCGIGGQLVRDYCCTTQNADVDLKCDGIGYWKFDNSARECGSVCEIDTPIEENKEDLQDCGIGGQEVRNACCADQNEGSYQGCIGNWVYNNSSRTCTVKCNEPGGSPPVKYKNEKKSGSVYSDPTSQYCSDIDDENDQNLCCNDTLKNTLSTGPRPGFPDCIGEYSFDKDEGCVFDCSDRVRMLEIIDGLKQKTAEQQ